MSIIFLPYNPGSGRTNLQLVVAERNTAYENEVLTLINNVRSQ